MTTVQPYSRVHMYTCAGVMSRISITVSLRTDSVVSMHRLRPVARAAGQSAVCPEDTASSAPAAGVETLRDPSATREVPFVLCATVAERDAIGLGQSCAHGLVKLGPVLKPACAYLLAAAGSPANPHANVGVLFHTQHERRERPCNSACVL